MQALLGIHDSYHDNKGGLESARILPDIHNKSYNNQY
jgi:hypothetical protein